ncbi:H-NS histone family protein [Variibacter gotjawalensis]|uniref:H-NS histone family protein n=1 Tax=Variibacter gotjawalensis TaxID=1333996 RepID=A0A0S3PWX7_9BRAD|nr:H-NS histone family protein [Variibacter gotjawalensis]NIK46241.1 DNA-binding protein H-NS [Variibacter gotjawalensis]RZS48157.1 DNA-binding protein H-NS [Variibacter gotjawalensis]BAT60414.1 H-NS histone family protein [Variibacter gotjawalensis]
MNEQKLAAMSVEDLIALRGSIDQVLKQRLSQAKRELQDKLATLERYMGPDAPRRGVAKGTKVAPKYRGPDGETWAGRGARPKWLVAAMKGGAKMDDFLIKKPGRKKVA